MRVIEVRKVIKECGFDLIEPPWGSQDILWACGARDSGSNPDGGATHFSTSKRAISSKGRSFQEAPEAEISS